MEREIIVCQVDKHHMSLKQKDGYGVITSIGSGVVTIQGLLLAFVGQVISIMNTKGEPCCGIIVNLARDQTMNLVT